MHIDIEYLNEFLAMAEENNYTEAAERMFISQSTLFKHIKTLENELGVPLFEKSGRKITITSYGKTFLPYAQQMVKLMDNAAREIKMSKESEMAMVLLGAEYRTHDLVKAFCMLDDDYRVKVTGSSARKYLLDKRCELAIVLTGLDPEDRAKNLEELEEVSEHVHLTYETAELLVSNKNPISKLQSVNFADLKNEEFITIGMDHLDVAQILGQRYGFEPYSTTAVYVGTEAVDLVGQNMGITILHRKSIDSVIDVAEMGCTWVPLDPPVEYDVQLYWRTDVKLSKAAKKFRQFVQDYYARQEEAEAEEVEEVCRK